MKIVDFLSESLIVSDLESTSRDEVLEEIVSKVSSVRTDVNRAVAFHVLMERERLSSTGIGNGFAIPHAKLPHITTVIGCFARSSKGVAFGALDHRPVHLFLTLLAPEGASGLQLKALARASRLFKNDDFRARLLSSTGAPEIWSVITTEDRRVDSP
ncbi:PTS sugar transporter subunit IIA [Myxococcota bacterium]|nr:PTS sugar transporter subunit IIA [Myxococcota bacterium]